MADRPYTVLSCGVSIDGYLDSAITKRLHLSNEADFDRVDEVRASCDAILVGAATIRNDNPRLLVRAPQRRAERIDRGWSASPIKVTVTRHGDLDPAMDFFADDGAQKLVYCPPAAFERTSARLGSIATVISSQTIGRPLSASSATESAESTESTESTEMNDADVDVDWISQDLSARGISRLMVEGGGTMLTQFLVAELADELHLVVAPLFVGDSRARRFVDDGPFAWNAGNRATLAEVRQIGDVVLLRYALSARALAGG
jgi:5-amino-6-(5-phosphoribosylamino)uracil reductase